MGRLPSGKIDSEIRHALAHLPSEAHSGPWIMAGLLNSRSALRCVWSVILMIGWSVVLICARADDWPQWRGPQGDGVWREEGIVDEIPEAGLKILWRAKVAGGYAGPAVAGGRIFVTDLLAGDSETERVLCFDAASGKPLWKYAYHCAYEGMEYGAGPRVTPTVNGGKVYTLGSMGALFCLDAVNGELVWRRDLVADYDAQIPRWGVSAAPLVADDLLIVLAGGRPGATVIAFDRDSGEERWRALDDSPTYSAPILVTSGGQRQIIVWTSDHIAALRPGDGKVQWKVPHKTINGDGLQAIASPVVNDDLLLCLGSFSGRSQLLRLDPAMGKGATVWSRRKNPTTMFSTPYFPTADHFYASLLDGRLACIAAASGDEVWANEQATGERATGNGNTVHLTPNGERVFLFNQKGQLILASLSPAGYEEHGRCWLLEPTNSYRPQRPFTWAHPAYANKCIYVRNDRELICASLAKGDVVKARPETTLPVVIRPLAESPEQKAAGEADVLAVSKDGEHIASAYVGSVKIFSQPEFGGLAAPAKHRWRVVALDFSPDGKLLASAGGTEWMSADGKAKRDNAEIVVWDIEAQKERARLKDLHAAKVMAAVFSPDGKTLATGSGDRTLQLLDVGSLKVRAVLKGHKDAVIALAFSPDGKTLASASRDAQLRFWDPAAAVETGSLEGLTGEVQALAFSSDGKTLATGGTDWKLRLWDVTTRTGRAELAGHRGAIYCLAFSPDGDVLATGSGDQTIALWDLERQQRRAILRGHQSRVTSLNFTPDGATLLSCADEERIKFWEIGQ